MFSTIDRCVFSIRKVDEIKSMSPSFNKGNNTTDYILIYIYGYLKKISKKDANPQIACIKHPFDDSKQVVRFISAFPGEWIKGKNSEVYHKIPEGHCWVECLNGEDDSNTWGPIPLALAFGKPILKVRPFTKIVTSKKINKNIKKKLDVKNRVLNEDNINSFFL